MGLAGRETPACVLSYFRNGIGQGENKIECRKERRKCNSFGFEGNRVRLVKVYAIVFVCIFFFIATMQSIVVLNVYVLGFLIACYF